MNELGVSLVAEHLITDVVSRDRTEVTTREQRGIAGQLSNLILVADEHCQIILHRRYPARFSIHVVVMNTNTPTLGSTLDFASKQQRKKLMTEADPQ